jgi:hypothetical protein
MSNRSSRRRPPAERGFLPGTPQFHLETNLSAGSEFAFGEERNFFVAFMRAATLWRSGVLVLLLFVTGLSGYGQQVTHVPPFVGTNSETWERFGSGFLPSGTSILGGIATISGGSLETATSFQMCTVRGRPSDGMILLDSDRPSNPVTISFSQPVSAFGAYWGSGLHCFGDPPSILTFQDVAGNIIGTDSFVYTGDGTLMWHGYRFGTPVQTITRTAGDHREGFAFDGLQATVGAAASPRAVLADFNSDGHPDYVLQNVGTRQRAIWYLNNNVFVGSAYGPTLVAGWSLGGAADFNRDSHSDYALFAANTHQTALWYLSGPTFIGSAYGPSLPGGWELVGAADFNGDNKPDYVLYNSGTRQTAIWYLNNNIYVGGGFGPTLANGWALVGVADFNGDSHPDYALFNSATRQTAIWYLSGPTFIGGAYGPTPPGGWALVAAADFNGNGKPDYLLYNAGTRQTAIWYLNNNVFVSAAFGPTIPAGWSLLGR